jgi:hypothetical protein
MKTHLRDRENNIRANIDLDGKIILSELKEIIEFRIAKHNEFIKRDKLIISENVDFPNVVTEAIERINEREAKIGELDEFIKCCL